jgi:transcriptional regulator with XRE-family HTH domain
MAAKPNSALIYRRVPAFLRQMREDAGMTQRALAERVGRAQWWIARAETGSRRVDIAEFVELCRACGVKPDEAIRRLARTG